MGRGIDLDKLRRAAIDVPEAWSAYLDKLAGAPCAEQSWVVYDDPPAAIADDEGVRKVEKLRDLDREIQHELLIASAYFVPTTELLAWTLHQYPENRRNSQPLGRRFAAKVIAVAIA